ncbi:hypothetical protein VPHF86_0182 [Vibrio phage F86]
MKFKLPNWLDNVAIAISEAKNYPKVTVAALIVLALTAYVAVTRVPAIASCTYTAVIDQSVPWSDWRHNMWNNNCQYFNGKRWIDIKKVMDVGAGELDEIEG